MTADLTYRERVKLLRHCAGRLQADTDPATRWLGQQLTAALSTGKSLDGVLGFRPPQGSKATAAQIIRRESLDRDIARLVDRHGIGGASLVLRGITEPTADLADVVERLQAARVGTSVSAVSRAIKRSHHRR